MIHFNVEYDLLKGQARFAKKNAVTEMKQLTISD